MDSYYKIFDEYINNNKKIFVYDFDTDDDNDVKSDNNNIENYNEKVNQKKYFI
jgi:hypothetical protein